MAGSPDLKARDRVVETAGRLLRSRGYAAASLRDIVEQADAPWGSLQYYFPGGKSQLAIEAIALGRGQVGEFIDKAFAQTRSAEGAIRWFFDRSSALMEELDYEFGCPVATVALEHAVLNDEISKACGDALADWVERFAAGFKADGIDTRAARRLAGVTTSQYEGALLMSRVQRTTVPMRDARIAVEQLIAAAR